MSRVGAGGKRAVQCSGERRGERAVECTGEWQRESGRTREKKGGGRLQGHKVEKGGWVRDFQNEMGRAGKETTRMHWIAD